MCLMGAFYGDDWWSLQYGSGREYARSDRERAAETEEYSETEMTFLMAHVFWLSMICWVG